MRVAGIGPAGSIARATRLQRVVGNPSGSMGSLVGWAMFRPRGAGGVGESRPDGSRDLTAARPAIPGSRSPSPCEIIPRGVADRASTRVE